MASKWSKEEIESFKSLLTKIIKNFQNDEELREAMLLAKLLTELAPHDADAWYFLGVLNRAMGAFDEARSNLFRSLELGGDKFSNYKQLANLFMDCGNIKEGIKWGYQALKCNPENFYIYHKIADFHILEGKPKKAIKILEKLLNLTSIKIKDKFDTLVRLGLICISIQQVKKALDYFRAAQILNPTDESLWADIGHCLSLLGDMNGALKAFKRAANSEPSALNLYNLGDAYLALNDPERAITPLVEATKKKPGFLLAHYDLSLAFIKMKKYEEGAIAAIAALGTDPEMKQQRTNLGIGAMNNLGLCLMNLGRYEDALECFQRIIKLFDSAYFNIGLTFFKMKHYKEALKYLQKALEIRPNDPEYLDLVGQIYTELGKYKLAEKYLRKSINNNPKYALAHYDLGVLLAKIEKRRAEAIKCFLASINLDPNNVWAYYSISCVYALSGDKEKALDYLNQALEKGFSDKKYIDSDPDMDNLRKDANFIKLMEKYF